MGNYKSLGRGGASRDSTYPFFATVAAGGSPPPASLPPSQGIHCYSHLRLPICIFMYLLCFGCGTDGSDPGVGAMDWTPYQRNKEGLLLLLFLLNARNCRFVGNDRSFFLVPSCLNRFWCGLVELNVVTALIPSSNLFIYFDRKCCVVKLSWLNICGFVVHISYTRWWSVAILINDWNLFCCNCFIWTICVINA